MPMSFFMVLALVSTTVFAEWSEVGKQNLSTLYVDPATVQRNGETVAIWFLHDLMLSEATADGKPYRSSKQQVEYDCLGKKARDRFRSFHSGSMGEGDVVASDSSLSRWEPVPTDSTEKILLKLACNED